MLPLFLVILPFTSASLGQVVWFCGFTPKFCAAAKTAVLFPADAGFLELEEVVFPGAGLAAVLEAGLAGATAVGV